MAICQRCTCHMFVVVLVVGYNRFKRANHEPDPVSKIIIRAKEYA